MSSTSIQNINNLIVDNKILKFINSFNNLYIHYQGSYNSSNEPNGYGKVYSNFFNYHGYLTNGKFNGKGILHFNTDKLNDLHFYPVKLEGLFKDGLMYGNGKVLYNNGNIYIGNLFENKRFGLGSLYDQNGNIIFNNKNWNNDKLDKSQEIIMYHDNGYPKYKGKFDGFHKNGLGTLYDSKGSPIFIGNFKKDKFDGEGKLYYHGNTNFIAFEGIFENGKIKEGSLYNESGNKLIDGKFKNDKLFGIGRIYSSNLKNKSQISFNGEFDYDYCNKTININHEFINNISYGYKNGEFYNNEYDGVTKCSFKNGVRNGIVKLYDEKNKLRNEYNVINNKKEGIEKHYNVNGDLASEENMKNNLREGYCVYYNSNGTKKICGEYNNNKIIKGNMYFFNGKIKYSGNFDQNEKFTGQGLLYFNNEPNSIKYKGTFQDGLCNGNGIEYYKNDRKKYEGEFLNGNYHGQGKTFYQSTGKIEYFGAWYNGERHGEGSLFDEQENLILFGNWHYNEPVVNN